MPSLINLTHVNIWTTVATPGSTTDMWLHPQPPNPLPPSPKERAESARFPVPGVNHEKLLASPDFMLADERSIVQRDLVAGATSDQKYYFPTKAGRYLQITPTNVTSNMEYLPKYSLIVMLLACLQPAFSRNNSVCEAYTQVHQMRPPKNREAYEMYFLQGDQSGTCLCVNESGTLYVEDCSSVLKDGRAECVFYVKPPQRDDPLSVIYSYEYPRSLKRCRSTGEKHHKACSKRWYVQIKGGGRVKTKRAKPYGPLDQTVTYWKQPQPAKEGVDQKKFSGSLPTTTPLVRHQGPPQGSQGHAAFNIGKKKNKKRNKNKKNKKKKKKNPRREEDAELFNLLSGHVQGQFRHQRNRARKKGVKEEGGFLIGHE